MSAEGVAAGLLTVAGVGVIGLGIVHAHWPQQLEWFGITGSSLGWTDQEVIPTGGGTYINEGTLLLWSIGAVLILLGRHAKKAWAVLAGMFLAVMGLTVYLFQFPYG